MTKRKLKVYGWRGYRSECPPAANGNKQTREICAAPTKTAALRAAGTRPSAGDFTGETGNEKEIALAIANPGVVLWAPIDGAYRKNGVYRRADNGEIASALVWKTGERTWVTDVGPFELKIVDGVGIFNAWVFVGASNPRALVALRCDSLYAAQRGLIDALKKLLTDAIDALEHA